MWKTCTFVYVPCDPSLCLALASGLVQYPPPLSLSLFRSPAVINTSSKVTPTIIYLPFFKSSWLCFLSFVCGLLLLLLFVCLLVWVGGWVISWFCPAGFWTIQWKMAVALTCNVSFLSFLCTCSGALSVSIITVRFDHKNNNLFFCQRSGDDDTRSSQNASCRPVKPEIFVFSNPVSPRHALTTGIGTGRLMVSLPTGRQMMSQGQRKGYSVSQH